MLNRRQFITYSSATLAALSLPVRAEQSLTLWGPPVTPSVLLAIAAKQGKAKDIKPFTVKTWRNPDQLRAGLLNGDIAASIVPSYVAANLYNQGRKVKLFNIMTEGLLYLAAKEKVDSLKALSGKKLVIPFKNDMPDLVLQTLCKKHDIEFASLNVQYTATPPEALTLFLSGKADYALLPEPLMSMAHIMGKEKGQDVQRALDLQQLWGDTFATAPVLPQAGLLFTDTFITDHRDFITALESDLQAAVAWAQSHPEETAKLSAELLPFPEKALQMANSHSRFAAKRAADIENDIQRFFSELHALNPKITGDKLPDSELFYR